MSGPVTRRRGWMARLGIPPFGPHLKFVIANSVDSIGTGLVSTFVIIYLLRTTSLSVLVIGGAISVARLLALPNPLLVGPLIDRFGARHMAAAGNILSAAGFIGYLFVDRPWQIIATSVLVQMGHSTYWTSSSALVVLASDERNRTHWFGFVRALRNAGLALGGALGSVSLGLAGTTGLYTIMVGNALSYGIAALLLMAWRPKSAPPPPPPAGPDPASSPPASYVVVLRDARYLVLIIINSTFVFGALLLNVFLAVYIEQGLHRNASIAGALLVLAAAQVALTQTMISQRVGRFRGTRLLITGALINGVSFALFAVMDVAPTWMVVPGLFLAMAVLTFAETLWAPSADTLSVELARDHMRGRYLAVYQLSWTLGQVTAPVIFAYLFTRGPVMPLVFLIVLSAASILLLLLLERMTQRTATVRTASAAAAAAAAVH